MSFDLPMNIEHELEDYAQKQNISVREAAIKLIQSGLKARRRKVMKENLVTDEQIRQLKALDGTFGLLEDVPEEQIERMAATIMRLKKERFPSRA